MSEKKLLLKLYLCQHLVLTNDDVVISEDDAVVLLKLQNCVEVTSELEAGVKSAIATYLRISENRVGVTIDTSDDGSCFITLSIVQSQCDTYSITELIEQLQTATSDPFNDLHGYIYAEENIPEEMTLDSSMFFIQQNPANVYLSESVSTSTVEDASNDTYTWYMYVAVGIAIGAVLGALYLKKGSKSSTPANYEEPTQQRRLSVAELLAASEQ